LVSDCGPLPQAPDNVTVEPMSFGEMKDRLANRLGMEVSCEYPQKLVDFKPTYGAVLEEYLEDYDFWGCTDIDLVYGQIGDFVTDDLLNRHDIVACGDAYLTGPFFLFRNDSRTNRLYQKSSDHQRVFQTSDILSFTECNFCGPALKDGASIFDLDTEIETMTEVIRREERNGLRTSFRSLTSVHAWPPVKWSEGHLMQRERELLLFHFVRHKRKETFSFPNWDEIPDTYWITKYGLWDRSRPVRSIVRDCNWGAAIGDSLRWMKSII
jgi:hypothetical protein